MSRTGRPRWCSRITYCATRSSLWLRDERNEKALLIASTRPKVSRLYSRGVKAPARDGRFAERVVEGLDDGGSPERVVICIERGAGALWAVGRQVNPQHRESEDPRADDYVWEGYELDDCLEAANDALEDDAVVSEDDGTGPMVKPFHRDELLVPLEKF